MLRRVWQRHYEGQDTSGGSGNSEVHLKASSELPRAAEAIESPYDEEARYRNRSGITWTGYIVHVSETCDEDQAHLITHVETTPATVHESQRTADIHQALSDKELSPKEHLVDAAYIDAELLVESQKAHGIHLVGPTRLNPSWQKRVKGAYDLDQFEVNWEREQVLCPQGNQSYYWQECADPRGHSYIAARFHRRDCAICEARSLCTQSKTQGRQLKLPLQEHYEALKAARAFHASEGGQHLHRKRAGIEGTISQGVNAFGLRQTRYRGLAKTHLQHVATAVAINLERIVNWLAGIPRAQTRTSRFAALAA